jgi:photosystem II stability/assembly factor-like uncharacterized protein
MRASPVKAMFFCMSVVSAALTVSASNVPAQQQTHRLEQAVSGLAFRSIGPALTTGRVADMAVDPRDRSTWYVAAASGGVWKTVNAGTTWEPIFDDQGSYSIGTVVIDPRDSDVIWVGTGENNSQRSVGFGDGIYKSADGGDSWRRMGLERSEHIGKILIDPRDSDVVLVAAQGPLWSDGGDRGLYRTRNGGETWERVLHVSDYTGITDALFDPRNPDVIYASSYQRRRHVGILIAGGPESTIFKSTDGGDTWREIEEGLTPVDRGRIGLAISPQRPDVVYATIPAAGDSSGFYRSENGGETWVRMSDWVAGDPQYYQELFPDPHRFDRLVAEAVTLQITEDGGRTWEPMRARGVHVDHHHFGFDPDDPDHLFLGNDGGLYESFDGAQTWRFFSNLPITQYYRIAVDDHRPFYRIFGGTQDNGTQMGPSRTRDREGIRNDHWSVIQGGDGFQARADREDPDIVFSESQYAGLRRANLRTGETAGIKPPDPEGERLRWYWDTPLVVSRHFPGRVYFAANRVFRSDDRGDTWIAISPDLTRQLDRDAMPVMGRVWPEDAVWKHVFTSPLSTIVCFEESPLVPGLLYAGTDDGSIQVSENDGESWRATDRFPGVPAFTYVSDVEPSKHDPNTVYATFQNHKQGDYTPYLLQSPDRGRTWQPIRGDLPDRQVTWSIVEDHVNPLLLFVGTEFGVFVSVDGGAHWTNINRGIPVIQVRDLAIQERENDLVAGTFGRGFYILDDYSPLRHLGDAVTADAATLFPVKDAVRFNFEVGSRGSQGNAYYVASNPPYGATFTVYLPPDVAGSGYSVVIHNAEGTVAGRVDVPQEAGIQRVVWELRGSTSSGRGGSQARRGRRGPEAGPGLYVASLVRRDASGTETGIGAPQQFRVRMLDLSR